MTWTDDDPLWYKDAIIYELHVRAYKDSDGDGIGDFAGLAEKLDYLQDLGVTAIWLLPFNPSPLKDDGYDIADYTDVHPSYGTLRDFKNFLQAARRRGLKVITELVLNHTSDAHPWFQKAKRAESGTVWREYYVWSDTAERYGDARVIFGDFEASNWSWDPVAKAYYWHRFYSHQPDLNYDRASVRRAMLRTVDFWFNQGVSGLRLDAVPYLYQREGTNCENLPETHAFLKSLRKHVDERFKGRMLLAEANQWPEDAADYFGDGDECHMAFQFPIMPRLFMAIRMEDRFPIMDIIQQTPVIPDNCQWALFLRNHDELTLEMVTDEERDYMYRVYAHDPLARINLGIRRRLAPLLNNDRKKIELMNSLLFSLPGTPIIYYGDEIGMGDNFYLGDRNGVRTPMQWSSDRNAGFSLANPQRLYLPVIIDPEYHYEAVNAESQQRNPDSLLWWMKRLIAMRKRFKAFGRGSLEFLYPENPKVLAFVRRYQEETVLIVANLSRVAQHTTLNLGNYRGRVPTELFGRSEFPPITDNPYFMTLSAYAFYWFSLEPATEGTSPYDALQSHPLPTLTTTGKWEDLFRPHGRMPLEQVLSYFIQKRRWYGGKARRMQSATIEDIVPMPYTHAVVYLLLLRVEYTQGEPERYILPLHMATDMDAARIQSDFPSAVVGRVKFKDLNGDSEAVIYDAMVNKGFTSSLLESIGRRRRFKGEFGEIHASPSGIFRRLRGPADEVPEPAKLTVEQTNTSVLFGDRFMMKLYRRVSLQINPELEIGRFLTEKVAFPHVPPLAGALEYHAGRDPERTMTVGILHGYIKNAEVAWNYTLDALARSFERILIMGEVPSAPKHDWLTMDNTGDLPESVEEGIGPYLEAARLLGQQTAEMHLALSLDWEDPNFAPEPFSVIYQRSMYHSMRSIAVHGLNLIKENLNSLTPEGREDAEKVLRLESSIMSRLAAVRRKRINAMRTRIHGDYHLGQVLYTGREFVIIDFEGEPTRPVSERRLKRTPLKDVAGMIRSFHYVACAAVMGQAPTVIRTEDVPVLKQWSKAWYEWVSAAFLRAYLDVAENSGLLPRDEEEFVTLLNAYLLEKALYEITYELNNRPDWTMVPLEGIIDLMEGEDE